MEKTEHGNTQLTEAADDKRDDVQAQENKGAAHRRTEHSRQNRLSLSTYET